MYKKRKNRWTNFGGSNFLDFLLTYIYVFIFYLYLAESLDIHANIFIDSPANRDFPEKILIISGKVRTDDVDFLWSIGKSFTSSIEGPDTHGNLNFTVIRWIRWHFDSWLFLRLFVDVTLSSMENLILFFHKELCTFLDIFFTSSLSLS